MGGNFVGVVFVSKLGTEALAASNLISYTEKLIITSTNTALGSGFAIAKRRTKKRKTHLVGDTLQKNWLFGLGLSVPMIGIALTAKPALLLLRQDLQVANLVSDFF